MCSSPWFSFLQNGLCSYSCITLIIRIPSKYVSNLQREKSPTYRTAVQPYLSYSPHVSSGRLIIYYINSNGLAESTCIGDMHYEYLSLTVSSKLIAESSLWLMYAARGIRCNYGNL